MLVTVKKPVTIVSSTSFEISVYLYGVCDEHTWIACTLTKQVYLYGVCDEHTWTACTLMQQVYLYGHKSRYVLSISRECTTSTGGLRTILSMLYVTPIQSVNAVRSEHKKQEQNIDLSDVTLT